MPDLNHQSLLLIVDRGASTKAFEDAQLSGVQGLLWSLESEPGLSTVTMVQFDEKVRVTALMAGPQNIWIDGSPSGGSALYDAIAKGVMTQRQAITSLPEHARPWGVQVLVVTDGEDSASSDFDERDIEILVSDIKGHGHWQFYVLPVSSVFELPESVKRLEKMLRP